MTTIKLNNKYLPCATEWNELSQQQLLQVIDALFLREYTGEQVALKLLKVLFKLSYLQFFRCRVEDLEEYLYLTGFLIHENKLTKNIIPSWRHKDVLYFGPSDGMNNLLMEEFYFTEKYYLDWVADKETIDPLNELVAVLYRPVKEDYDFEKDPDGDARVIFNENTCSYYAKNIVNQWPMNFKISVATWYEGYKRYLVDLYPNVSSGRVDGDPALFGLLSVMRNIAKQGVHGNFDAVGKKYVSMMMMELTEIVIENERLKNDQTKP